MYIDSYNLKTIPVVDDLYFLADMALRENLPGRRQSYTYRNGKKRWFDLDPEPSRKAILIAAPMIMPTSDEQEGKVSKSDVIDQMINDLGRSYMNVPEQQEFYDKAISIVNKLLMRSTKEPLYQFDMHHWIRSTWLLHDMQSEEARNFRCDWYAEQIGWNSNLDPLGFVYIMAKREIYRKFGKAEPDDRIKVDIDPPEISELSDKHEWFEVMNREAGWMFEGDSISQDKDADLQISNRDNYFVRILGKKNMWNKRREWNRNTEGAFVFRKFQ